MHIGKEQIAKKERIQRLNFVNSLSGIKSPTLIGTKSMSGITNLAVFNSVLHIGSSPALLGFVLRPDDQVRRHTYENILQTGFYTFNHVPVSLVKNAHYTSAQFEAEVSEFDQCALTEEYLTGFFAPFVKECSIKIGLKYIESILIKVNGTKLVIGEIEEVFCPDDIVAENGILDLEKAQNAAVSGLNSYYSIKNHVELPYARPDELPNF